MSQIQKLAEQVQQIYEQVNTSFKIIIDSDPGIQREDSARGLLAIMNKVKEILMAVNKMSLEQRARNFNLTYNAVVYISDVASLLRKSNYAYQCVKQLMDCALSMEGNIILQDVKYLEKRTKIYLDICHIYEESQYLEPAISVLESAIAKYKQLKAIHEMDPPVPVYIDAILGNNLKILKVMWIKYSVQIGSVNPNDWKKKVDEQFGDDVQLKLLSLVQCLRTQTRKQSNIFQKNQHTVMLKTYKQTLVQVGFEMVKPSLDIIQKGLNEQKAKIEREISFKNTQELTQELINEQIKKKRQVEDKYVKLAELKKACSSVPFQYHAQLIHYAYEVKNTKILPILLEVALLRAQCRRIQVPYINDVGIIASSTPNPNIPNGYEKVPVDLNEANLKTELKKLRKKNEGKGIEDEKPAAMQTKQVTKDAKKGGKDPKQKAPQEPKKQPSKDTPTEWQLQQINHKFVYMIIKRTMSPENAVYDLNIVMGDQQQGPVGYMDTRRIIVPYIQQDMTVQQSKVKQYKGIKQSTNMVPYIIMKHSKSSLQQQLQMRNVIIDVKPLVGKNPIIPPSWGYRKIPIDLRQVPQQFVKTSTHDYVYITYKTDQLFYSCKRHVDIINALVQLESSHVANKVENIEAEKMLELGINYSLEKFNTLFEVVQRCLEGRMGQDYYLWRCDFLTHLTHYIWNKYVKNPLVQFDYVNEMRLNDQLVDYDYRIYREVIDKCKPIFLNGFKVLNFIMVNNQKSDVMLLSRLTLQLLKLQEEDRDYKAGIENCKLTLDKLREYRDQYLTRGIKGSANRLLPYSITCSNFKIKSTIEKMQKKFTQQRNFLKKQKRIDDRKKNKSEISEQQIQEQEVQYLHYQKKDQIDSAVDRIASEHMQLISIVSAIELDLQNILFRLTLKHAEYLKIVERQSSNAVINGIKESSLQGLAASMRDKLSLMASKNQQKNTKNLKELQSTLIQANKLPPPKPGLHWLQKKTIEQYQKNPYAMTLLMSNFSAINSQSEDKKYFLQESLSHIKKCIQLQNQYCELAIKDSIFLFSTLWDDQINYDSSSGSILPFKQLYDGTWPCSAAVPDVPILISKSSTSICLKMPPYKNSHEKKKKKIINMTLFGKPSANGVDVSTNCDQLEGTGIKNQIDEVVRVRNLKPNNVYCFAVAATNEDSQLESIGKTCTDILTSNPLPISMLAGYIAKTAYQINQYQTAYLAAKIVADEVCQPSGYQTPDQRINYVYSYKLRENILTSLSILEIRTVVESLYILALCERRRLAELREKDRTLLPIVVQEKQQKITNWLMLASLLNPVLSSPIISIPFLIPQDFITFKALSLSLIPPKWMNSRLKQMGVKVMEKVLKWGLEKNEIGMARRIVYRWGQRKWVMLGKLIQVEEKKQTKKGSKDPKDQQVKTIEKYCRLLIEKAPGVMDLFEDTLPTLSDQYSDFTNLFIQRAREQIAYYSQFVDNPPEQLQAWTNRLNSKLELLEMLKQPLPNIKKFADSSPYYLEYNCKLVRKALENVSTPAEVKVLYTKCQQLSIPSSNKQIAVSKDIQRLMFEAIEGNIEWIPSAKNQVMKLQEKTGKDLSKEIQIYTNFENKMLELTQSVSKMDSFLDRYQDYDYLNLWIAELYYLKATVSIMNLQGLTVRNPIKGRYEKVRLMNLQDLLKKRKQVDILQKQSVSYSPQELKNLTQILRNLCDAAYASYTIENWIKLQNIFKIIFNLINKYSMTPFYHIGSNLWQHFTLISLLGILMLAKIKKQGFNVFKNRYSIKQSRTQLKIVANKIGQELQPLQVVPVFVPRYWLPQLDPSTTKNYWFQSETRIDMPTISSVLAYAVQTLRIQNKYNLVINLSRDFCNVTQHYYSLGFLPFMIESQQKLIDQVKESIEKENLQLNEVVNEFTKKKTSKMKGQRQHKLTNEPLPYQIEYQEKRKKILESIELLTNHKNHLQSQIQSSQTIIQEIKRDTSKTVLKQREQRKYMMEFGDDEEHMFKNYGDDTRLAKNRKNAVRDIIDQYDRIYKELKNNKTSKDPLAEIQNRNEVGNLHFAAGSGEKASEFWQDSLATIFKTVRPIDNYLQILAQNKGQLVSNIGEKELILSLNLLYKIAKYGSFNKLYYQYNCTRFATELCTALYLTDSRHPQTLLTHATYRLTRLSDRGSLEDEATISLSQLINSLQFFILRNMDQGSYIQTLPLVNFYQHVVVDVVKNVEYAVRAKLLKVMALANTGLVAEAVGCLAKVANEKDLPNLWIEPSDQVKREKGQNWHLEQFSFDNSKNWTDPANKQVIEYVKKLTIKPQFVVNYGLMSLPVFHYARGLILFKIFAHEIYDNVDSNQARIQAVQEAQNIMRDSLKRIAFLEQHYSNLQELQAAKLKLKQNQLSEDLSKALENTKNAAIVYLKSNGVEQQLTNVYLSQKPAALKRVLRVEFMVRIRFSIHETYQSRRLSSSSFHVLKNALTNLHRISYGTRRVETGYDPEISNSPVQPPAPGKKEDKKAGKKQEEKVELSKQQINWQAQKQKQSRAQQSTHRTSLNIYWHMKLSYELGKLMYEQNRFANCKAIMEQLISESKAYLEHYYSLFAQGYILRCMLRLGNFDQGSFQELIALAQSKQYLRQQYVELVMDLGEILRDEKSVGLFNKGHEAAARLWGEHGMRLVLDGLDVANPERAYANKQQLTPQQEEEIKRRSKKVDKKPGKDEKKATKKQDPKKKKQQAKVEYKVELLSKYEWWNLLDEDKKNFDTYTLKPHPNFYTNNIYSALPLQFIKCFFRYLQLSLKYKFTPGLLQLIPTIRKYIIILQGYPVNGYYYLVHLYYCLAEINKSTFIYRLKQLLGNNSSKKVKAPMGDLPLNNDLICLPSYTNFIYQNRGYLQQAQKHYRKVIGLLKGNCLLFDAGFRLEEIVWKAADNELLLAEYCGRMVPKYYPIEQSADAETQGKLISFNHIGEALTQLDLSIKILSSMSEMAGNYSELGSRPLEASTKLDTDICNQILQLDRQAKSTYAKLLTQNSKPKQSPTATQLITFLNKLHRECQFMTFSKPHLQNVMLRCHRILAAGHQLYKERCIVGNVDFSGKKSLEDKFMEVGGICMKAISEDTGDKYLYIVGGADKGERIYYGRLIVDSIQISTICERLYHLRAKMGVSAAKSEAVRNRDYALHNKQLKQVLVELGQKFHPAVAQIPEHARVALTVDNLSTLIRMLEAQGVNLVNRQINSYIRYLHELKYRAHQK